jgi:hypothetical protein
MLAIAIDKGNCVLVFDNDKLQHMVEVLECNEKRILLGFSSTDQAQTKIICADQFPDRYFHRHPDQQAQQKQRLIDVFLGKKPKATRVAKQPTR